jgi:hypothetical protein
MNPIKSIREGIQDGLSTIRKNLPKKFPPRLKISIPPGIPTFPQVPVACTSYVKTNKSTKKGGRKPKRNASRKNRR